MTHRDVFRRFSDRSVGRSDAEHRKQRATQPENRVKSPFRLFTGIFGGRRKALPMRRHPMRCITRGFSPTRISL